MICHGHTSVFLPINNNGVIYILIQPLCHSVTPYQVMLYTAWCQYRGSGETESRTSLTGGSDCLNS